jgi:hypothetical protein
MNTAVEIYRALHHSDQRRVLDLLAQSAGAPDSHGDREELAVNLLSAGGAELESALTNWWQTASLRALVELLELCSDQSIELAALACAEAVADLSDDPRVTEARRVRIAWVRGEATDEQRDAARAAVFGLSLELNPAAVAAYCAGADTICAVAGQAGVTERVERRIRALFESPVRVDHRIAAARW